MREQEHEGYVSSQSERPEEEAPTFVLDVPVLNVDELDLEVNDLRAHIALRAELADLVKINVGVDVYLDKVKLDIKGVEAQALLKIKLDKVLGTLNRALESIDKNPQILGGITRSADMAAGDAGRGASQGARGPESEMARLSQLAEGAADQPGETAQQTGDATDWEIDRPAQAGDGTHGQAAEGEEATRNLADLQIEEEYVDERGRIVGRARDGSGNIVEGMLDDEGEVLESLESGETEDRESEDEEDGEVEATDAARRKADELGVKLSGVRGTGSRGRVLVKDVEKAARAPAEGSR